MERISKFNNEFAKFSPEVDIESLSHKEAPSTDLSQQQENNSLRIQENLEDSADKSVENEEKKDLSEQAINFFNNLLKDKPIGLVEEIANLLKQGDINKVLDAISECPDISVFQQKVLEKLEDLGIVEDKGKFTVVDIEALKKINYHNFRSRLPRWLKGDSYKPDNPRAVYYNKISSYFGKGRKLETMFYTFNNLPVISKEDYGKGKRQTKDLFYIPETAQAAFDVDAIKKADFYLSFSDILSIPNDDLMAKNQDYFDKSAYIAMLIYHPKYGDGYRDEEDGRLKVRYKDNGYKPIRADFFEEYQKVHLGKKSLGIKRLKRIFENDLLSELEKRDLIRRSDFEAFKSSKDKPHELKKISRGYVTIHNADGKAIRYYVGKGKELAGNPKARVVKINEEVAAVINEDAKNQRYISYYFHLTDYDNPDLLVNKPSSLGSTRRGIFKIAAKDITRTTAYNREMIGQEDDNTRKSLEQFEIILNKIEQIKNHSGVDILKEIADENHWQKISSALLKTTKEASEISQFISKNGIDQLAEFATADVSTEEFDKYISLGANLEQETAKQVLLKYNEIIAYINKSQTEIKSVADFGDNQPLLNIDDIKTRAKKILLEFADESAQAKLHGNNVSYIKILKKLDAIEQDVVIFASLFKEVAKSKDIQFNELQGISLANKVGINISDFDKKEMREIYKNNRQQYPKKLLENFEKDLDDAFQATDSRFYIAKLHDKPVSFIRYEDLPNGNVYVGSFNVRPEAKSSAIGNALFKTTLQQEGKDKVIEGVVYSKHPKFDDYIKYLESLGFKVVEEIDDYEGTGEKFYKIERQPQAAIERSAA